jgi:S-adenosylmethionine:tRNA ribosyltransferase-isomerase
LRTSDFRYHLPESAIAQAPLEPRDSARLLVASSLEDHRFSDLPDLLQVGDLLVVNRTRVRRARLVGEKEDGGGRVEVLLLAPLGEGRWNALVRPARRLRRGSRLVLGGIRATLLADPEEGRAEVGLDCGDLGIEAALERWGRIPLPPYFKGSLDDPERYQTVYSADATSAAAPTAGLHFTHGLLERVKGRGLGLAAIELDIGVDTFRPISSDLLEDHRMHRESVRISEDAADAVNATRRSGGRVVAVGTTVVRALESAADPSGTVRCGEAATDLFIRPGYRFRAIDMLVTNFHVPGSSLVVLVAAFMGQGWRETYRVALERGYRFLSFGDAMFAERAR